MPRRTPTVPGLFSILLLLSPAAAYAEPEGTRDKDLEGDWQQSASVKDGKDQPSVQLTRLVFTFKDGAMTFTFLGKEVRVDYKIDPTKSPKTMDLTSTSGSDKGRVTRAIYEVNGDELRICEPGPGEERPTDFSAKEGSGRRLLTMKRVKK